jgi:hypothetical protein
MQLELPVPYWHSIHIFNWNSQKPNNENNNLKFLSQDSLMNWCAWEALKKLKMSTSDEYLIQFLSLKVKLGKYYWNYLTRVSQCSLTWEHSIGLLFYFLQQKFPEKTLIFYQLIDANKCYNYFKITVIFTCPNNTVVFLSWRDRQRLNLENMPTR